MNGRRSMIVPRNGWKLLLIIAAVSLAMIACSVSGIDLSTPTIAAGQPTEPAASGFPGTGATSAAPSSGLSTPGASTQISATSVPTTTVPSTGANGNQGLNLKNSPSSEANQQASIPTNLTDLYKKVSPGVVSIRVQISSGGQTGEAAGSGFVIDDKGYIITNFHVAGNAQQVYVTFNNGLTASANTVGLDNYSDLAVLKVDNLPEGVHSLPLADSDKVAVGEWVIAMGNPFNVGTSMSLGIVSAVGRVIPAVATGGNSPEPGFSNFSIPKAIQTDAAINPGNSGGPLIDMNGDVIGVNAQIQSQSGTGSGVGFAIPSNIVKLVAPTLAANRSYQWPWVGISGVDALPEIQQANHLGNQQGAYIVEVVPGGPAEKAGLKGAQTQSQDQLQVPVGGDLVIQVDDQKLNNYEDLLTYVAFKKPGDKVNFVVIRNGQKMNIPITLEPRPANIGP